MKHLLKSVDELKMDAQARIIEWNKTERDLIDGEFPMLMDRINKVIACDIANNRCSSALINVYRELKNITMSMTNHGVRYLIDLLTEQFDNVDGLYINFKIQEPTKKNEGLTLRDSSFYALVGVGEDPNTYTVCRDFDEDCDDVKDKEGCYEYDPCGDCPYL